jgi:CubicO group peptidase (beta-lactamase class C family)
MVAGQPSEFEPGSQFKYSNTNYILLGMIIEKLSGLEYAEFIQREICAPLGLKNTRYVKDDALTPQHARGYEPDAAGNWAPAPPLSMTQPFSAGALESTIDDLAAWTAALDAGKVINESLLQRAWTPFATTARPSRYGFGWYIREQPGERWIGHGGAINGFMCEAVWIPEKKVFVAVLRNSLYDITPQLLTRQLALEAVGRPMPVKRAIAVAPAVLGRYGGTYVVSPELKFTVTRNGPRLFVQPNGQPKMELFAEADDRFFTKSAEFTFQFVVQDNKAMRLNIQLGRQEMTAERQK